MRIAFARSESAELTREDADVRVVDVAVVNVGGEVAILSLAHVARDDPERVQVMSRVEFDCLCLADADVRFHLLRDGAKLWWNEREINHGFAAKLKRHTMQLPPPGCNKKHLLNHIVQQTIHRTSGARFIFKSHLRSHV